MKLHRPAASALLTSVLGACASSGVQLDTQDHLAAQQAPKAVTTANIPAPVQGGLSLPPPKAEAKPETYSVVVNNIKVQDLLFALARDAKVNVDIDPGVTGTVTLNALDQTLPQLLNRIARQADLRFELDGSNLVVMPDTPFLRTYKIDYVNMARDTTSSVSVSNQIATAGSSTNQAGGSSASTAGNGSSTTVSNTAKNHFWDTLVQNLKDLLRETDKVFPEGAAERTRETSSQGSTSATTTSVKPAKPDNAVAKTADSEHSTNTVERTVTFREAASVIANPETGVISVRATSRQQEKVQEFLSTVMSSARRQVLIEASVAEVDLSQNYQQGVDWSKVSPSNYGFRVIQGAAGTLAAPGASLMEIGYDSKGGNFSSAIKLLETFGNVKVLSSPKITVLNNQTAMLKVVDNAVYFTIKSDITNIGGSTTANNIVTYTTTVNTIPIGLVLNVTPQIGEGDSVLLNLRPSLSRIIGEATDPNPTLKQQGVENKIPIVRAREIESMLRVSDGNVAVMGGLMEDMLDNTDDTVPGLAGLPIIGNLFQNKDRTKKKTELVIFIRPTVIRDASLDGDFRALRNKLPDQQFFDNNPGPEWPPRLGDAR